MEAQVSMARASVAMRSIAGGTVSRPAFVQRFAPPSGSRGVVGPTVSRPTAVRSTADRQLRPDHVQPPLRGSAALSGNHRSNAPRLPARPRLVSRVEDLTLTIRANAPRPPARPHLVSRVADLTLTIRSNAPRPPARPRGHDITARAGQGAHP